MSTPRRSVDRRSGLVLDTRALGRRAGAMRTVDTTVEAPDDLGTAVIGVPAGSPVELDLRLESVVEGVLVTGTARLEARGECVRCLGPVVVPLEVEVRGNYRVSPKVAERLPNGRKQICHGKGARRALTERRGPPTTAPRRGHVTFLAQAEVPQPPPHDLLSAG